MDKAIEQIFKVFNHLAREVQVYLFSGFIIAVNALLIDHFFYSSTLIKFIKSNNLFIPTAITLYIVGQFCMSFYYVLLELTKLDKKINSLFGFNYSVDSKSLPKIYAKNTELYIHFVERYVILTMMRWTLSAACFINLIIDIILLIKKPYHWQFLLATVIFGIGTFTFYLLTSQTEKDYSERIDSLKNE